MSFKGIKKSIARAPQNLRQKFNRGEITTDPVYTDAERRFKELEIETEKLSSESSRYFNAVNDMLKNQIDFSKAIGEIYKPISGRLSDPLSTVQEDHPEGIEAAEQYAEIVTQLKESVQPELELIENRVVAPAKQLLDVIKRIRKMATKREHKKIDLDRHRHTFKKYEEKKDRSAKDEEKMYNAQAEVENAQEEYDYFNEMLKEDLPKLFQMQSDFIKPLFVSFYYMQLNIFYTLSSRMEEMKIPYFDMNSDIVEAFYAKRGDIDEKTAEIGITHFKVGYSKKKVSAARRRHEGGHHPHSTDSGHNLSGYSSPEPQSPDLDSQHGYEDHPPLYSNSNSIKSPTSSYYSSYDRKQAPTPASTANTHDPSHQAAPSEKQGHPPYTPQSPPLTCTALYDYTAQAEGDLTFSAGDSIEIIERTPDPNHWWTGKLNGQVGLFPGNYVKLD